MAEAETFVFDHKEILELLIKRRGLHEGLWRLYVEFALAAGNAGPSPDQIMPTAFLGIKKLGLIRVENMNISGITVDAAAVNPAPQVKRGGATKTSARGRPS